MTKGEYLDWLEDYMVQEVDNEDIRMEEILCELLSVDLDEGDKDFDLFDHILGEKVISPLPKFPL